MNVVLVHGIFDNGAIFRRLVAVLEAQGHRCWVPVLNKPADGRRGIEDLAQKFKAYIDQHLPPTVPLAIIGFSMGCIVCRQYMQVLGGALRTLAFFAISGPHRGTLTAYLYFGRGAEDLRPGSPLLSHLSQSEARLAGVRLFSYWTSRDLVIVPASSGRWAAAEHTLNVKTALHRFMPSHRGVCADIVHQLRCLEAEGAARGDEPVRGKEKGELSGGAV